MRFQCLVCLFLASLVYGQAVTPAAPPAGQKTPAAPASAAPAATPAAPEKQVTPDDPVITLKGFCPNSTEKGDACKTVITRAEFEKMADALQPNMQVPLRRQLANQYSMFLRMSAAAEERGLDKTPVFDEQLKFSRMRILGQDLNTKLQQDSQQVSDAEIAEYYQKNEATFQQATLQRIFIPRSKQIATAAPKPKMSDDKDKDKDDDDKPSPPTPATEEQKKAAEEAMVKLSVTIHADAVKGEDFDKLQKEVFSEAGMPGNAINTKIEKARRNTLPPAHQSVMDLKPGQVSDVIADQNNGHYIYKMVSIETLSLETVSPEIKKTISTQRYRESMHAFQENVDLNEAYFGPSSARGPGMMPPRGPRPAPEHAVDPD
jgi:hypothetical protein